MNLFDREPRTQPAPADFHEWIQSLPWVVERPYGLGGERGVRTFAVECEPLGIGQLWLVTGLPHGAGVAVVVPRALADDLEHECLGGLIAPMPGEHALFGISYEADATVVERVVLTAYGTSLS